MTDEHQIDEIIVEDNDGDVSWRCQCGEVNTGYAGIGEARLAAAEHQLPEDVQLDVLDSIPRGNTVEIWRAAILDAANDAAETDPGAWQWYHDTAHYQA